MDTVKISEQQFYDYMDCPVLYALRNINKINIPYHKTQHKLITQVMKYFLTRLYNGIIPTFKELQRKWNTICLENKDIIDEKKNISGWQKIVTFATWAQDNKIAVGGVSIPYVINVQNVVMQGNIDQILVDPETKKVELFYPNFTDRECDEYSIQTYLKYTIDAYAFNELYKQPVDGIHIYSAKSNKNYYTYRGEQDFKRLTSSIYNIGNAIAGKYFYPRENIMCSSCPGKIYCRYWYQNQ